MNELILAETMARLKREKRERALQTQLAALEAENQRILGYVQRFLPAGSPPPLAGAELAFWICRQMHERIEALEADRDSWKAAVTRLEAERDNWKETVLAEIEENKKLFDLLGLTTADSFGHKTSTQAVTDAVRVLQAKLRTENAHLRQVIAEALTIVNRPYLDQLTDRCQYTLRETLRKALKAK